MRIRRFAINPTGHQPHGMDRLSELLTGAVHVETFTKDEGRFGGDRSLIIFAFYPDETDAICKHRCFGTCCGKGNN